MARGPIPDKPADRPSVPDVLEMASAYLTKPGAPAPDAPDHWNGGSLHITLIDCNESDEHVRNCRERAVEYGDTDGIALADALLAMTRTQRRKICRR